MQSQHMPLAKRKKHYKKHFVHLFLLPAVLLYGIFQLYPLFNAAINSFYSWNGFDRDQFVGLENFRVLLTEQPYNEFFLNAFKHNWIFFGVSFFSHLALSFILALIIYSKIKGKEFFKTVLFLPKLLSVIVIGFLFSLILNPTRGALNSLLETIGLDFLTRPWLGSTDTALVSVILVDSWASLGFATLIFLAGLQAIDSQIFEAARIDGATGFKLLYKITLPMTFPALMVMSVLTFISSFEAFELIYAMQGSSGGPYYSTDVLAVFFYRLAFGTVDGGQAVGIGSAIAVILFLIIASATAIILFYFKRKDFER